MNEAWLNTPSLRINVNFEKFYCTTAFIRAKLDKPKMHQKHRIDQSCMCWSSVPIGTLIPSFGLVFHVFDAFSGLFKSFFLSVFYCKKFSYLTTCNLI